MMSTYHKHCLAALFVAMSHGCAGAEFSVRVWGPDNRPLKGAQVIVADPEAPACYAQYYASGTTDDEGLARIVTEWCAKQRLIVAAPDMGMQQRVIDTCQGRFQNVDLKRSRPARAPTEKCSETAYQFSLALTRQDTDTLATLVTDPEQLGGYLQTAAGFQPWAIDVESVEKHDGCQVTVGWRLDSGCAFRWRINLVRSGDDDWRVAAFEAMQAREVQ